MDKKAIALLIKEVVIEFGAEAAVELIKGLKENAPKAIEGAKEALKNVGKEKREKKEQEKEMEFREKVNSLTAEEREKIERMAAELVKMHSSHSKSEEEMIDIKEVIAGIQNEISSIKDESAAQLKDTYNTIEQKLEESITELKKRSSILEQTVEELKKQLVFKWLGYISLAIAVISLIVAIIK